MGRQYCENPELGGLDSFDSSRHLDLRLSRTFWLPDGASLQNQAVLNLDNVTDAVVLDQCGLPQPGRTFRIQVRIW